ncbi:hypothetical protein CYLTODRAFT_403878 [Cylindrobasidium torrendii FP15055 ss-10]|uniref:Xylanolytic transcriptional activator regulatory domain-containing protein n=1 Tax=Cylindrobasidium torrendii FP15055 ss-10 TaxID=1314674 RepID=A0A0D7AYA8_9AGAR|nr:hypothetical protein CYLTODRAFT_403878 [Cylindrobasidium torrendii FP15055 ss-10]
MPGRKCSNCLHTNSKCTHVEVLNALGSARGYVLRLERRVKDLENLFAQLLPAVNVEEKLKELSGREPEASDDGTSSNNEELTVAALSENMRRLVFRGDTIDQRFYGKSCIYAGVVPTLRQKRAYIQCNSSAEPWHDKPPTERRTEMWCTQPWPDEGMSLAAQNLPRRYTFPPESLLLSLVDLYFEHENPYLPLLHRPTFQHALATYQHLYDPHFGATVLLVCALGAPHSHDLEVFVNGRGTAGWKWFIQVSDCCRNLCDQTLPSVYEVQMHALACTYLLSCALWRGVHMRIQLALRLIQDVGAHTQYYHREPNTHTELWRRAFWVLFCLDVHVAMIGGTTVSTTYEDFDVDFPFDCDDEYWDHPDPACNFKQPLGTPSSLSYFVCHTKLAVIKLRIHHALYTIRKPFKTRITPVPSQEDMLALHDEQLWQWYREIPPHLADDAPVPFGSKVAMQRVILHYTFQHLRVFTHQPYIIDITEKEKLRQSRSAEVCQQAIDGAHEALCSLDKQEWPFSLVFQLISCGTLFAVTQVFLLFGTGRATRQGMEKIMRQLEPMRQLESRVPVCGATADVIEDLFVSKADLAGHEPEASRPADALDDTEEERPKKRCTTESVNVSASPLAYTANAMSIPEHNNTPAVAPESYTYGIGPGSSSWVPPYAHQQQSWNQDLNANLQQDQDLGYFVGEVFCPQTVFTSGPTQYGNAHEYGQTGTGYTSGYGEWDHHQPDGPGVVLQGNEYSTLAHPWDGRRYM